MAVNVARLHKSEFGVLGRVEPVGKAHAGLEAALQVGDQLGRVVSAIERAFSVDGGAERAEVAKADAVALDERLLDFVLQGVEHGLRVGRTYRGALLDALGDGVDGDGRRLVGRCVELDALVHRTFFRYYYILEHRIFGIKDFAAILPGFIERSRCWDPFTRQKVQVA